MLLVLKLTQIYILFSVCFKLYSLFSEISLIYNIEIILDVPYNDLVYVYIVKLTP